MSLLARSCLLTFLVACVESPDLTTTNASNAPGAPGTASAGPGGMILVPAVILDVGDVVPTGVTPIPKGNGANGDNNGKGPKDGHGAADAGTDSGAEAAADAGSPVSPAPPPQVAVPSFWLDATETSVASYRRCIDAGACAPPEVASGCTLSEGLLEHPVTCVTIEQARVFCTWVHKRLVTNDEYSAAATGATHRAYPWGADPPAADRLNACGGECSDAGLYAASDGFPRTAPTASFARGRTPEGAYDLAGNVAEWVEGGTTALARGGSYEDVLASSVSASGVRSSAVAGPLVGFRCAADAPGQ
jgi:formylglycine-generating enzyme required for sulfatase activity